MIKKKMVRVLTIAGLLACLASGCASGGSSVGKEASADEIKKGGFTVAASCHDPQILREGDTYYMFGSHMVGAKCQDLRKWNYFANGVDAANTLFDNLLTEPYAAFDFVGKNTDNGYSVWASNVIYNETMKKYVMYFCTTSSYVKSTLCFATADNIEGPYTYVDTILYSGYGKSNISETNLYDVLGKNADISRYLEYGGYNNKEWPNCIDPAIFTDADGRMWMNYGSWSGGIFLLEIDPTTGYPIYPVDDKDADPYYGYRLIGGGHHSAEGPYIQYDAENGYYYLFASINNCCDGERSRYKVVVGRSQDLLGPYLDKSGKDMINNAWELVLEGDGQKFFGPGHNSIIVQDDAGTDWMIYHSYVKENGEVGGRLGMLDRVLWTEDGWPYIKNCVPSTSDFLPVFNN